MTIFTMENVRKTFTNGEVTEEILKGVHLSLREGELTALVGASGSGKSTLLTIAAGLQATTEGQILFAGKNLADLKEEQVRKLRAEKFGFVFQSSHLVPFLTVEEQLVLMLEVSGSKKKKQEQRELIMAMLQLVGMDHRKGHYPSSLSGGEKQRVAIARAIIHQPQVLFADEPTASLDSKRSSEVLELIQHVTKTLRMATLMVTHDEGILSYADQVIKMSDGQIVSIM